MLLEVDWRQVALESKEYAVSLERDRATLWRVNEELREKIAALERGSEELQNILNTPLISMMDIASPDPDIKRGEL